MYGAPVTAPMEVPRELPSFFSKIPAELPAMKDASVGTVRLEGTLAKRLPSMPSGELNNLSFTNSKQLEAAELMRDMRYVYDISRGQQRNTNKRVKARSRATQRQAERSLPQAGDKMSKAQSRSVRSEKSTVLRNARDVLGMGTDLYK